jgi:hypothetical protein
MYFPTPVLPNRRRAGIFFLASGYFIVLFSRSLQTTRSNRMQDAFVSHIGLAFAGLAFNGQSASR